MTGWDPAIRRHFPSLVPRSIDPLFGTSLTKHVARHSTASDLSCQFRSSSSPTYRDDQDRVSRPIQQLFPPPIPTHTSALSRSHFPPATPSKLRTSCPSHPSSSPVTIFCNPQFAIHRDATCQPHTFSSYGNRSPPNIFLSTHTPPLRKFCHIRLG